MFGFELYCCYLISYEARCVEWSIIIKSLHHEAAAGELLEPAGRQPGAVQVPGQHHREGLRRGLHRGARLVRRQGGGPRQRLHLPRQRQDVLRQQVRGRLERGHVRPAAPRQQDRELETNLREDESTY